MPTVQSGGALQTYNPARPRAEAPAYRSAAALYPRDLSTYAAIYRTQPEVRTVIDFLALSISQLGLHAFRRISDTDRQRLAGHEVIQWLDTPSRSVTRFRLFQALVTDLGIYNMAYWWKVRTEERVYLLRLPPEMMDVEGWLQPTGFVWTLPDGQKQYLEPRDVVYFHGFDPDDPTRGLSLLETLRKRLCELAAADEYKTAYWNNAARIEGVIQRPATAPRWTKEQKDSFREQWSARFAGPHNAGQAPVLEDGMTFQPTSFSSKDSELNDSRKFTREEICALFHVPQPMVGILDHATYSNITEQHKMLYQDCLGPWLEMLQQEIEAQLLAIECEDTENVYLEFNISDKLKGSFEEQGAAIQNLVGRPVMTANEGRARLNLSSMKDDPTADELAMPLNLGTGGTPATNQPTSAIAAPVIRGHWQRQRERLAKVAAPDRAAAFDGARWDRELAADLEPLYRAAGCTAAAAAHRSAHLARSVNADTLQLLVAREDPFSPAREAALYV